MHILAELKKELSTSIEEAGYTEEQWKKLDEKTKKQYIKDHPNSKYAQKDKPSEEKAPKAPAQKPISKERPTSFPNEDIEIDEFLDDYGTMNTEQAKRYWKNHHNDDPILEGYDSFEDWYKESKENGCIVD